MDTNNIQVFEIDEVLVDFFGNNMELLAVGHIKPTMLQFIPADVKDYLLVYYFLH